jgi:protein-tyrosine phosphatase
MNSSPGVVRYFTVFLDFVGQVMKEGGGVLIHCLAGEFRARIVGVAWLMYANNLSVEDAIKLGKSRRDVIDPVGKFPNTFECNQKWTEQRGFERAYKMELTVERTR